MKYFIHFWNSKNERVYPENIEAYEFLSDIVKIGVDDLRFGFFDLSKTRDPWDAMMNYCIDDDRYDSCAIFTLKDNARCHAHMAYAWSDIVCAIKEYSGTIDERLKESEYGLYGYNELLAGYHWYDIMSNPPMQLVYHKDDVELIETLEYNEVMKENGYLIGKCIQYNIFYEGEDEDELLD